MSKSVKSKQPMSQIKIGRGTNAIFGDDSIDSQSDLLHAGLQTISLHQIRLPDRQPRKYFDPTAMAGLVASVKAQGVLEPILVRPLDDGFYEIIAGERRYRAATEAGTIDIPAIVKDISAAEAWQIAIVENLLREDLNPIEETESILELLCLRLNLDRERAIALLYGLLNDKQRMTDNVISQSQGQETIGIFEQIGTNWESFIANRLPLLKLPADILEAIGTGKLEYTKGRAIARIVDPLEREQLLRSAIDDGYSLAQIRQEISDRAAARAVASNSSPSLSERFDRALKQAKKSRVWGDAKKQKKLERLVSQLEELIEN
jgi:ParB family transcriptional regulator, chromosome partitioning protein